jgi:hypothetical protein
MTREECLYFHASYKKPKSMLKKHVVSAVGFDRHNTNPDTTGPMLLGTLAGAVRLLLLWLVCLLMASSQLLEATVDRKEGETKFREVFKLPREEPIVCIRLERTSDVRVLYLLASCLVFVSVT